MKLYSGPLSLFTAKVRIALAEKELDYERIEVGWSLADRYRPHHPDVVALNPKAEVPVLVIPSPDRKWILGETVATQPAHTSVVPPLSLA